MTPGPILIYKSHASIENGRDKIKTSLYLEGMYVHALTHAVIYGQPVDLLPCSVHII